MITVITPTGDRWKTLKFCDMFIKNQIITDQIQWIIVDDSLGSIFYCPADDIGVKVQRIPRTATDNELKQGNGAKSLAANLLTAIPHIKGDYVFIVEDDDWYSPIYLHNGVKKLQTYDLAGTLWQCYYNLEQLSFKVFRNKGSALCSTCFRKELLPAFKEVCKTCYDTNFKGIDYSFWKAAQQKGVNYLLDEKRNYLCIGMKSLPGRKGIGIGHIGKRFNPDPTGKKLREWVGDEWAEIYLEMRNDMFGC